MDVQREPFDGAVPIRHPLGYLGAMLAMMDAAEQMFPGDGEIGARRGLP